MKLRTRLFSLTLVVPALSTACAEPPAAQPTNDRPLERQKSLSDDNRDVARDMLYRWQEAARHRLPLTWPEQRKIAADHPSLSGHQQLLLHSFHGPVSFDALISRFDWELVDETAPMRLVAIPREPLDRLLCEQIEIQLGPDMRPITIVFGDPAADDHQLVDLGPPPHRAARPIATHRDPFFTPAGMTLEATTSAQPDPEYSPKPEPPALLRTAAIEDAIPLSTDNPPPLPATEPSPFDLSLPHAPTPSP